MGTSADLPVVAVENIGHAQNFRALDDGAAEQGEALGVIVIVAQRRSVKSLRGRKTEDSR